MGQNMEIIVCITVRMARKEKNLLVLQQCLRPPPLHLMAAAVQKKCPTPASRSGQRTSFPVHLVVLVAHRRARLLNPYPELGAPPARTPRGRPFLRGVTR